MRARNSEAAPELHNAVSEHFLTDAVSVILYSGLLFTLEAARRSLKDREILVAYRQLSGDDRVYVDFAKATNVVLGEVQSQWYLVNGHDVPQSVTSGQELRLQEARMAKATTAATAESTEKTPRVTNRSIICAGLLNGDSEEKILAAVKKVFPEGKADQTHVRYYRHFLEKEGQLEKPVRPVKEKVEKPVKTISDAPPAAKKTAPPAKKTASAPVKARR